jgi:hypothetical protein
MILPKTVLSCNLLKEISSISGNETMRFSYHFQIPALLSFMIISAAINTAQAQYFGRNKVQYESFDFKVLQTAHFDIYYYAEKEEAVQHAARMAERWYARVSRLLNHQLTGKQPLILYANQPHFQQTNAIQGTLGEGTGGVTEAFKRRMVQPFAGSLAETDHVLGHELVHALQFDISGGGSPGAGFRAPSALRLPLWFIEGMAEYLTLGHVDPHTAMWMRDAARVKKLPTIRQLSDPRYFPYRFGQAFWAYVAGRWGDETVGRLLRDAGKASDVEKAIKTVLSLDAKALSQAWHDAIHTAYDPLVEITKSPDQYGRLLISDKQGGGNINLAPALSPDGKQIVFFSEKDLFSIDMFLADAETGKIKRKITNTAVDPHFESLQFINSAGAWDAQSRRFAFAAIKKGQPVLSLLDVTRNRMEREITLRELGEILNPTWSPDGRYLAFSALVGGLADLFIYDLEAGSLRQMTNDAFADLHPAWSPDGQHIAFVTDRFSTALSNLKFGNYRIALMNPVTGAIQPAPGFDDAKNINPQWSADAKSLYFLSDQNGITNLYRADMASGEIFQITNLYTGVSGITALSPALSVASRAPRLAFSVFENGKYGIYTVDAPETLAAKEPAKWPNDRNPAALPPMLRANTEVLTLIKNPDFGLPAVNDSAASDYRPKLSLDYIGQPYLVAGVDRFGTSLGGGVSLFWSDMLGNHNLATLLQATGNFKEVAAVAAYQNLRRRWNWGAVVEQIPYVAADFAAGFAEINGTTVYVEQQVRLRQINRDITGVLGYPFSRAQRLEFSAGYRHISFDNEIRTIAVSTATGRVILDRTEELPSPRSLSLGQASAALVYDNSIFGATSPILGQRYRFEPSVSAGSLSLQNVLADYRRYAMPLRPFTLAARVLHYGRYGRDAEDNRLMPLFIGYPTLVRGYDAGSFSPDECGTNTLGDCAVFDQLLGSKMLVGNFELRFPLLGVLGLGGGYYGFLPIEFGAFYDAGVAWTKNEKAWFLDGSRDLVRSAGATLRLNLLGYLIAEVIFVNPIDRPKKGWHWQFSLTPGF